MALGWVRGMAMYSKTAMCSNLKNDLIQLCMT